MASILRQLEKYHEATKEGLAPKDIIQIKQDPHPHQKIVETICDIRDPVRRQQVINDALLALNDFAPPPMTNQLYPLETAILYHLFYRHKIIICAESIADLIFTAFLKTVSMDAYMQMLKTHLDKDSITIFLYRVMLAAFGARGKLDNKRDHISREYGIKAAMALGVESSAKAAGRGLDSLANVGVEQLILGRITYIAFWEWSHLRPISECSGYLELPSGDIPTLSPSPQKLVALPHRLP